MLQREQPLAIWGTALAGREVAVTLGGQTVTGNADARGEWRIALPPQPVGGPYHLKVSSGGRSISRSDILIGDVFLCSGQSNME